MSNFLDPLRRLRRRWKLFTDVNWLKTYSINYKMFPKEIAKKLPIYIYGNVKFTDLSGQIRLGEKVQSKMIRIGFNYEKDSLNRGAVELNIAGLLEFKGYAQISKDCFVYVAKDAQCSIGDMVGIASRSHVMCENSIVIGDWTRISAESQIYDTDFHTFINSESQENNPVSGPIHLGSHNFIGYRTSIKKNTKTPDYCTIASNSLCTKDYSLLGENILIGGVPALKLKDNYTRLWPKEKERLKRTFKYR